MSAGYPATLADVNNRAGSLVVALRDDFAKVAIFKAWLDTKTNQNLLDLGMAQADIDTLKSAFSDADQLRTIYEGSAALAVAKDFRTFQKLLAGVL